MPRAVDSVRQTLPWLATLLFTCVNAQFVFAQEPAIPFAPWSHRVVKVAISPDGKTVASATDRGSIRLWDVATGQQKHLLGQEAGAKLFGPVILLTFSSDGKTLLSTTDDHSIKIWDTVTGKERANHDFKKVPAPGKPGPNEDPIIPLPISSVAISQNSKMLAIGAPTGIKLWNTETGKQMGVLQTPKGSAFQELELVEFDQSGKLLAVIRGKKVVEVWNVAARKIVSQFFGHKVNVESFAFSPDGTIVASGDSLDRTSDMENPGAPGTVEKPLPNGIWLWNASTGKELAVLKGHEGPIKSLIFTLDGKTLVSASDDQTIRVWDVAGKQTKAVLSNHSAPVTCLSLSLDGKTLASGSIDQTIKLWDVATAKEIRTLLWTVAADRDPARSACSTKPAFSPDGKTVFYGTSTGMIRAVDATTGKTTASFEGAADMITSISLSKNGKTLVSGGFDFLVRIWDVPSGRPVGVIDSPNEREIRFRHGLEMQCLLSPDGRTLATVAFGGERIGDNEIKLWDVPSLKRRTTLLSANNHELGTMAFSSDSKLLAWADGGEIRVQELEGSKEKSRFKIGGGVYCLAFSPDNSAIGVGTQNSSELWSVAKQARIATWNAGSRTQGVAFHPQRPLLATASAEGALKLWNLADRKELSTIALSGKGEWSIAFSPDGTRLAATSPGMPLKVLVLGNDNRFVNSDLRK
ncbi:hypothetical protein BH10PLA2_BH10PLA2_12410 [soil metagenome]